MSTEANDFTTDLAIIRYRGDGPLSLPLTNPDDGTPFDPAGCALLFTLKAALADADAAALVQKSSAVGGITVADPAVVTLVPADFAVLAAGVTYFFDVQAQLAAAPATIRTVGCGTLKFAYDVTREVTLSISTTTTNPDAGYSWAGIPDKPSTFPATLGASLVSTVAAGSSRTLTIAADARSLFAELSCSGTGTAIVILSATNALDGCWIALRLLLPAPAGLTIEVRNETAGGTLLATVTSDGTAGTVGLLVSRGAAAWDEPTAAAWLD